MRGILSDTEEVKLITVMQIIQAVGLCLAIGHICFALAFFCKAAALWKGRGVFIMYALVGCIDSSFPAENSTFSLEEAVNG